MTKIKVLAWLHIVLSGGLLAVGLFICIAIAMSADMDSRAPEMILPMFFSLAVFLLIPAFVGAIGLLYLQWWARVMIILLSLMHLALFPVGTVLGGFGLWVLLGREAQAAFGDKIVAAQAARAASGAPIGIPPGMIGLLVAIAGVGSGFIAVIGAGFLISGDPAPVELMSVFYPGVGVFALCLAYGIYRLIEHPPRFSMPSIELGPRRDFEAERRARIARLRADPATAKYAALIEAGETWTDEQIAYDRDPSAVATCVHLQPVERAMRASRIAVKLWSPPVVQARCRVDERALRTAFQLAPSVTYAEPEQYDRSLLDPPGALLWCSACSSRILVVHPSLADVGTPLFPASAR